MMKWHYMYSSVTGQKVADIVNEGEAGTTYIYAGGGNEVAQRYSGDGDVQFKSTDPVTGSTRQTNADGEFSGNEEQTRHEIAGLGTYVPHNQIYAPPPPSYMEGASATNPENGCEFEGVPTPCSLAQLLREHPPYPIPKDPPKPVVVPAEHNVTSHSALRLASHGPSANADESTDILIDESIPKIGNFFVEVREEFAGLSAENDPVLIVGNERYEKKKRKALKRLSGKHCQAYLEKLSTFASVSDIQDAINTEHAYSATESKGLRVRDSGIRSPQEIQAIEAAPRNQGNDVNRDQLDYTVADFLKKNRFRAVTNQDPAKPGIFYGQGFDSETIMHESIHYATGLDDPGLANLLGLRDSAGRPFTKETFSMASEAIRNALNKNCP